MFVTNLLIFFTCVSEDSMKEEIRKKYNKIPGIFLSGNFRFIWNLCKKIKKIWSKKNIEKFSLENIHKDRNFVLTFVSEHYTSFGSKLVHFWREFGHFWREGLKSFSRENPLTRAALCKVASGRLLSFDCMF